MRRTSSSSRATMRGFHWRSATAAARSWRFGHGSSRSSRCCDEPGENRGRRSRGPVARLLAAAPGSRGSCRERADPVRLGRCSARDRGGGHAAGQQPRGLGPCVLAAAARRMARLHTDRSDISPLSLRRRRVACIGPGATPGGRRRPAPVAPQRLPAGNPNRRARPVVTCARILVAGEGLLSALGRAAADRALFPAGGGSCAALACKDSVVADCGAAARLLDRCSDSAAVTRRSRILHRGRTRGCWGR